MTAKAKLGSWRKQPAANADFAVKFIYMQIIAGDLKATEVFERAGVAYGTWYRWKNADGPIDHFQLQCVLKALGYKLKITEDHG